MLGKRQWKNSLFYPWLTPTTLREFQVWRHVLGTPSSSDGLVFEEKDEKYSVYISKSMTDKYILINCYSSLTSEVVLIDADDNSITPKVFLKRAKGHLYSVEHHELGYYVVSNKNAANKQLLFTKTFPVAVDEMSVVQALTMRY